MKETVDQFILRVEDRSSLLMMTGHDIEDGLLVEFFEFRHLTFQEFLTARAMVQGWHPGRKDTDSLASVLEKHFEEEVWREVIPLAAVLGGKATEALIQRLLGKVQAEGSPKKEKERNGGTKVHSYEDRTNLLLYALGNCLADEAAARPETIRSAIREVVRLGHVTARASFAPLLARSRYGNDFLQESRKALFSENTALHEAGKALFESVWWETKKITEADILEAVRKPAEAVKTAAVADWDFATDYRRPQISTTFPTAKDLELLGGYFNISGEAESKEVRDFLDRIWPQRHDKSWPIPSIPYKSYIKVVKKDKP